MSIISIIIGALAGSALAFEFIDLAPCGQTCIINMFNQANAMGCPPYPNGRPNLDCLCNDNNFLNGIRDCAFGACYLTQDAENTLGLAALYCTDPRYRSPACADLPTTTVSGTTNQGNTNNNANANNVNGNPLPRIDVLTYFSNGFTFVATVTVTPTPAANTNVAASSTGGNGGLRTATAFIAPTGLGNTAGAGGAGGAGGNTNVVAPSSTETGNKVDYGNVATSTKSSSGSGVTGDAAGKNDQEAKETGARKAAGARRLEMPLGLGLWGGGMGIGERVVAVVLGVLMVV